jgi:hypothetical protein
MNQWPQVVLQLRRAREKKKRVEKRAGILGAVG